MIIGIIDYGRGNPFSVASAVGRTGSSVLIGNDISIIERSDKIILPGVGAFGEAMQLLQYFNLVNALNFHVCKKGLPYLGICVGAQLIAKESEEFGCHKGLGWVDACVKKLPDTDPSIRIPHTGWDDVFVDKNSLLFNEIPKGSLFYYNHSYGLYSDNSDIIIGRSDYAGGFASALQAGNVYATLFHPEKSQQAGLKVIENFVNLS